MAVRLEEAQPAIVPAPASQGVRVRYSWQRHVLTFLMVFGPGLIVMEADNDAGAVSTYMQAGGEYGLHLLWLLVVLLPICYFRSGDGGAARHCNRQRPCGIDLRAFWQVVGTLLSNRFISRQLSHPHYRVRSHLDGPARDGGEPIRFGADRGFGPDADGCKWKLSALGAHGHRALPARPDLVCARLLCASQLGLVARNTVSPTMPLGGATSSLVFLVIAIVGTTIAPWQLFFQQSCVAEKRLRFADLKWARLDTLIGAISSSSLPFHCFWLRR